jgi:hypothetical protein
MSCIVVIAYAQVFVVIFEHAKHAGMRVPQAPTRLITAMTSASMFMILYLPYLIITMGTTVLDIPRVYPVWTVCLTVCGRGCTNINQHMSSSTCVRHVQSPGRSCMWQVMKRHDQVRDGRRLPSRRGHRIHLTLVRTHCRRRSLVLHSMRLAVPYLRVC